MAEHALETNHEIDWSSAKVVDISDKFHQRKNTDDGKLPTVHKSLILAENRQNQHKGIAC